jgi:hypothetical protein
VPKSLRRVIRIREGLRGIKLVIKGGITINGVTEQVENGVINLEGKRVGR